jgi:hypothetical protein
MMRYRERGVTFLGWLIILVPVALLLYAAMRLVPVYLEYMKIARTLEQLTSESVGDGSDPRSLRYSIEKRFDVEDVHVITADDIKITKEGGGYKVQASYEATAPYVSNVYLLVVFDKVVVVK